MKQFDVYDVNLDPAKGSELKKRRPAVIISPDVMNKHLATVIIAPLTYTRKGYPTRVSSRFKNEPGEIVLDQVRAVDKVRLLKRLGKLDQATSEAIKLTMRTMFG